MGYVFRLSGPQDPISFLDALLSSARVIALVGGGGKTSLMYALARRGAALGRSTVVTTTTHIFRPEDDSLCRSLEECRRRWDSGQYAVWGQDNGSIKLSSLSAEAFAQALTADVVLVEADGARRLPCKAPAEHEPQIPEQADLVIGVAGMSALGKQISECCFRPELVAQLLGVEENHRLTARDLAAVLSSPQGARKNVQSRPYFAVLNQCDHPALLDEGKKALEILSSKNIPAALTHFPAGSKEELWRRT